MTWIILAIFGVAVLLIAAAMLAAHLNFRDMGDGQ